MMSPTSLSVQTGVSMAHVRIGTGRSGRHAEISILQLRRGSQGIRVAHEHDRTTHQHVTAGCDGECDCNVLLDQDAADAHLATDPVDRPVHTLDDGRRTTERRLVHPAQVRPPPQPTPPPDHPPPPPRPRATTLHPPPPHS